MAKASGSGGTRPHPCEPPFGGFASRLNCLRAGVLGANGRTVSGIVTGVAGATATRGPVLTAGEAGLFAGAISSGWASTGR